MDLFLYTYLALLNTYAFALMGIDKKRARIQAYRISEKSLWLSAILGGAPGALLGMNTFRHKTKHTAFKAGMPLLAIIEIGLFMYWFV